MLRGHPYSLRSTHKTTKMTEEENKTPEASGGNGSNNDSSNTLPPEDQSANKTPATENVLPNKQPATDINIPQNLSLPAPGGDGINSAQLGTMTALTDVMVAVQDTLSQLVVNHDTTHKTLVSHLNPTQVQQKQTSVQQPRDGSIPRLEPRSDPPGMMRPRPIPKDISFGGACHEDVLGYISQLLIYSEYVNLSNSDLCKMFPLTLTGRALFWFRSLSASTTNDWGKLHAELLEKFGPQTKGFVHETALLSRTQFPSEPVEKYATDLMKRFQMAGCSGLEMFKTFVRGLRPKLRAFVLQHNPADFGEAETLAMKGEQLLEMSEECSSVSGTQTLHSQQVSRDLSTLTTEVHKLRETLQTSTPPPLDPAVCMNLGSWLSGQSQRSDKPQPVTEVRRDLRPDEKLPANRQRSEERYSNYSRREGYTSRKLRCYRCNSDAHLVRLCPHPPLDAKPHDVRGRPAARGIRPENYTSPQ